MGTQVVILVLICLICMDLNSHHLTYAKQRKFKSPVILGEEMAQPSLLDCFGVQSGCEKCEAASGTGAWRVMVGTGGKNPHK